MNKWIWPILLLALGLRLTSIQFGLPHLYHADEPIVVNHALVYGSGDLNPHFFKIPPLISYLLFAVYGIFFLAGNLTGAFADVQAFEQLFYQDPSIFYLIARIFFGAFAGTLTIALYYRLIKRYFSAAHALCGSFFFSVYFLHVRDSHYIYADIPLLLLFPLIFSVLWSFLDKPDLRKVLGAGFLIGAAAAVKYNGFFAWIPALAIFYAVRKKLTLVLTIPICLGAAAAAFFIFNPYALFDAGTFIRELRQQGQSMSGAGWIHHLRYSLPEAAGIPMLLAAAAGVIFGQDVFRNPKKLSLFIFLIGYYAVLAMKGQHYDRYVLPLTLQVVFFAAEFILAVSSRMPALKNKRGILLLTLAVALPSLQKDFLWLSIMRAPDVRTQAKSWVEENIPSGSRIALDWEFYQPRLLLTRDQLLSKLHAVERADLSAAKKRRLEHRIKQVSAEVPQFELYNLKTDPGAAESFLLNPPELPYQVEALKARGVRYVILAAYSRHPGTLRERFYNEVKTQGKLLREFSPYHDASRRFSPDQQPLTGGPFLLRDLKARKSNGYLLQVYQIQ